MTKRTLLFLLLWCVSGVTAQAQPDCAVSTKLICQLPVASGSLAFGGFPAFNAALASQLSTLPVVSSASGLSVVFTPQGQPVVSSENLGPIMTDRAETIGKHKLFLGFFYQRFRFNSIDGTGLGAVPLLFTTPPSSSVQ